MTNRNLIYVIILLNTISLFVLVKINHAIYIDYSNVDRKTKALFGLTEAFKYGYRYYLGIFPLIGLVISLILTRNKEVRIISLLACTISLLALLFSLLSVWRIFI